MKELPVFFCYFFRCLGVCGRRVFRSIWFELWTDVSRRKPSSYLYLPSVREKVLSKRKLEEALSDTYWGTAVQVLYMYESLQTKDKRSKPSNYKP